MSSLRSYFPMAWAVTLSFIAAAKSRRERPALRRASLMRSEIMTDSSLVYSCDPFECIVNYLLCGVNCISGGRHGRTAKSVFTGKLGNPNHSGIFPRWPQMDCCAPAFRAISPQSFVDAGADVRRKYEAKGRYQLPESALLWSAFRR